MVLVTRRQTASNSNKSNKQQPETTHVCACRCRQCHRGPAAPAEVTYPSVVAYQPTFREFDAGGVDHVLAVPQQRGVGVGVEQFQPQPHFVDFRRPQCPDVQVRVTQPANRFFDRGDRPQLDLGVQRIHQPWPTQLAFDGQLLVQQPQVKLHFFVRRDNDAFPTDVVPASRGEGGGPSVANMWQIAANRVKEAIQTAIKAIKAIKARNVSLETFPHPL